MVCAQRTALHTRQTGPLVLIGGMCWTMAGVRSACISAATAVDYVRSMIQSIQNLNLSCHCSAELVPSRNDYTDLSSETDTLIWCVCGERERGRWTGRWTGREREKRERENRCTQQLQRLIFEYIEETGDRSKRPKSSIHHGVDPSTSKCYGTKRSRRPRAASLKTPAHARHANLNI